ncbi:hypothetical protein WT83_27235 [Burkholderia territorii]|uniref:Conjugal transfer protein n=1 Tax=Burkholderia territorii TaxID=1503055 RepID=A0A108E802_9BURK|nr:TraU family protein [Burkholderia territorii]KWN06380.1 hypothetical protein WT83_27235 [Burkholderia territorii]
MIRKILYTLLALCLYCFGTVSFAANSGPQTPACYGRFPNPITDICWSCVLPIKLMGLNLAVDSQEDTSTVNQAGCVCANGSKPYIGITMSFFEPTHVTEVVRNPYCFPTLDGTVMDLGFDANNHAIRRGSGTNGRRNARQYSTFYHSHLYYFPLFVMLEVLLDHPCLELGYFDMAWMSEIDPTWGDPEMAFIFTPEVALFANPIAVASCSIDCVAATAGFPLNQMFWCAGCQGNMFPLTGWVTGITGAVDASLLVQQRLMNRMHRQFMVRAGVGDSGLCGLYTMPIMDKRMYKTQMLYPSIQTDKLLGRCCQPLGRTSVLWAAGKTYPVKGEDFGYMMFRKRDCCFPMIGF